MPIRCTGWYEPPVIVVLLDRGRLIAPFATNCLGRSRFASRAAFTQPEQVLLVRWHRLGARWARGSSSGANQPAS